MILSNMVYVCVCVNEETEVARGLIALLGYDARERQEKHENTVTFTFTLFFLTGKRDFERKKSAKLFLCVFLSIVALRT